MTPRAEISDASLAAAREELLRAASGAPVSVWPACSDAIPDDHPIFRVALLGPEWIGRGADGLRAGMADLLRYWGRTRRHFRNALAFASPEPSADPAAMYKKLWLPREPAAIAGAPDFEEIELRRSASGADLFADCVASLGPRLRGGLAPAELEQILGLGQKDCSGIFRALFPAREAARWFFCFLGLPRFLSPAPIEACIRAGVGERRFGLLLPAEPRLLALDRLDLREGDRMLFGESAAAWTGFDHPGAYLVWRGALEPAGR